MDNAIQYIGLNELIPGEFHPHLEYTNDNLDNLTNSIKNYGILEPLIVRPKEKKYEIILGNRRYNAAKNLGLEKIPVIVLNIDDETALNMIISDNIQRKELTSKEEAYLYDKAISYPNTNKEKLSINLGIPLDRITSKLNLLKKNKEYTQQEVSNNNNQANYSNQNNSVNNDIISLSELNKEEKEREDYNMNNNEFITNNMNNNMNNQGIPNQGLNNQPQQEPTFGGRFFPSMEDEPTNMNMTNIDNNINSTPFVNNSNNGPLIDLTDLSPEQPPQQINNSSSIIDNSLDQQLNNQPVTQPQFNIEQNQMNNQGINYSDNNNLNQQQPVSPVPTPEVSIPLDQPIEQQSNQQVNLAQNLDQGISIDNNQNDLNIPSINDSQQINSPMTNIAPEPPVMSQPIDINNNPNLNTVNYENIPNQIDINQQIQPNEQKKDIIPVVNMIKNLAISIESLGYKLNITEDDNEESYKIIIEVEK